MAARPRLPLQFRVENPPSVFVGRQAESEWLAAAIERAPVALVTGPAGIGKSALLATVLKSSFPDALLRTVRFSFPSEEPLRQAQFDLGQVLARLAHQPWNMAEVAGDPIHLTQALIDLAEDAGVWVVLEDLHRVDGLEAAEMLSTLGSYARESRWIASSRRPLRLGRLAGQTLAVEGLDDADLMDLARALYPDAPDGSLHRAVSVASGSPWLLSQFLETGHAGVATSRQQLVEGLDQDAGPFLGALAVLRGPTSLDLLRQIVSLPADDTLEALERRGLMVRDSVGVRIHDLVATLFSGSLGEDVRAELHQRAAAVLGELGPAERVNALRHLLAAGRLDAVVERLGETCEQLLACGQAPRLWAAIRDVRDPRLAASQMRCAAELGNPTALSAVHPASDPSTRDQLAWAHTLYARGNLPGALALAEELAESAREQADESLVEAAISLQARCCLRLHGAARALEVLATLGAEARSSERVQALSLLCHVHRDERDVEAELGQLSGSRDPEAMHDLASALYLLGRTSEAIATLDELLATPRGQHTTHLVSRQALLLRGRIHVARGELRETKEILDSLRPFTRTASLLRPHVTEVAATRALLTGELSGLGARLELACKEASSIDVVLAERLASLRDRVGMQAGGPPPSGEQERVTFQRWSQRHGVCSPPPPAIASVDRRLWLAERAMIAGDSAAAVMEAHAAVELARRRGEVLARVDAIVVLLDALLLAEETGPEEELIHQLVELGQRTRSRGTALAAVLRGGFAEPSVLERVAQSASATTPPTSRRARALLGANPPLDQLDVLVVAAMRRASGLEIASPPQVDARWLPGWGVDARSSRVWLSDGRVVEMAKRPLLFRLVDALVRRGDMSKEQLILDVWGDNQYHPSRHDPRVYMSVRKLRELIEEDPSDPRRITTTETGYRIGGVARRVVCADGGSSHSAQG
ncbi:MAG: AAA family ATPase [Deltaproteobacteria bacterium]|nr:AAA family ATPase [Deltaproteobacteria bacterium]